jgi:uncharacterized damage-inducible protein DinB
MTVDYIQRLFIYNFEMNKLILKHMRDLKGGQDRSVNLFAHLLAAEKIWMMRLKGEDLSRQIIWPHLTLEECSALLEKNKTVYTDYLAQKTDTEIHMNLEYITSKGEKFETPIIDILMHVIIHGGYHRGQLNPLIRQAGSEPYNTDYIHYIRYLM